MHSAHKHIALVGTLLGAQLGNAQTLGPQSPQRFQFYLDSFQIMDTRSFHEDTVVAGIGVEVNGARPSTLAAQLGNFNNGSFVFWQKGLGSLDNVAIGPTDTFVFMFQLYNNGAHGQPNPGQLEAYLDKDLLGSTQFVLNGIGSPGGAAPTSAWSVVLPGGNWTVNGRAAPGIAAADVWTGGLFSAAQAIFGGCDGPLGFGVISGTGADLAARVPAEGPLRLSADLKGTSLKFGAPCNHAGSHYTVNVLVQRR